MSSVYRTAGQAGSLTVTIVNSAGQLVTPVSTPTVQWYTDAGRTTGALSLSVSGSGSSYTATWTAPQAPATPATRYLKVTIEVSTGVFDVDIDDDISFVDASALITAGLCTVTEVKDQIGKTSSADDTAIQTWINGVTATIESLVGPVIPRTVTDPVVYPNGSAITVEQWPIVSVTSVTEYQGTTGQAYTGITSPANASSYTYTVERNRTIRRLDGSGPAAFTGGVVVVYSAGRSPVPDALNRAALIIVQHLWRTRNGGAGLPALVDEPTTLDAAFGYAVPNKALDLIQPYRKRLRIR